MRSCKLLGLAVCCVLATGGLARAQTTLAYKFKEGDKLNYDVQQKMKMTTSVMDKDIEIRMDQNMDMTWEVLKVEESGAAQVKMLFTRTRMSMSGPMGKVEIDSKDPKEVNDPTGKALAQVVEAIAGMELTLTMEPNGEMKNVKIPQAVKDKLKKLPNAAAMGDMFSEEGFKKMVQGGMVLPKGAVTKGKSWEQKMDMKMPFGKMTGDIQFTYEGTETKDDVKLDKISLKPNIKLETDPKSPFQMKVKEQEGKGYAYFDNAAGRLVAVESENTMVMAVEINNMSIGQRMVQITSMRLKK